MMTLVAYLQWTPDLYPVEVNGRIPHDAGEAAVCPVEGSDFPFGALCFAVTL